MSPAGSGRAEPRLLRPPAPKWEPPPTSEPGKVRELLEALRLPEPVCALLSIRGRSEVDEAKRFLRPKMEQLSDPILLADGLIAANRITQAIQDDEKIFIHGDYDVDGICATALLTQWVKSLGGSVTPFVPHRVRDGYDFSENGLAAARAVGATLLITVDCGTMAHETIAEARGVGIDVIVTDHHTVGGDLPGAFAVVNPQRPDCEYPDKGLCGTAVAFRLGELVGRELGVDLVGLYDMLDLVALASVADLVPLSGENRILVAFGLKRLSNTKSVGLRALLGVAGVSPGKVTAGRIGYQIAPRINAVGRIGAASDALTLLLSDDSVEAHQLATVLDQANCDRRDEDQRTLDQALEDLAVSFDPNKDFGVVLAQRGWHPGVVGIVASRVVERIHRPVVVVAVEGDKGRGSARSISGFNLYDAIAECSKHLTRFGGHQQAAGIEIPAGELEAFRLAFNEAARSRLTHHSLQPVLSPDLDIKLEDVDLELVHWLSYLGPHGIGNPTPVFRVHGVGVRASRIVGENHLKAELTTSRTRLDAIGFGLADRFDLDSLSSGKWDVLFRLERNEWQGKVRVQALLSDLRPTS